MGCRFTRNAADFEALKRILKVVAI